MSRGPALIALVFVVAALPLLLAGGQVAAADWPQVGGGPGHIGWTSGEQVVDSTNVSTLTRRWSSVVGSTTARTSGAAAVAGGIAYVGAADTATPGAGAVYAFDASTGLQVWNAAVAGAPTAPAVAAGRVFVTANASGSSRVYALDATTGAQLWSTPVDPATPTAVVGDDGVVYVVGGQKLYALGASDGSIAWSAPLSNSALGGIAFSPPAVSDGVAFVSWTTDVAHGQVPHVTAIDTATQAQVWDRSALGGGGISVIGTTVFVSGPTTAIRSLNTYTGATIWAFSGSSPFGTPTVDLDFGLVVASTDSGAVTARDILTGQLKWSQSGGMTEDAAGPPVLANGVAYVTGKVSNGTKVVAFDITNGTVLWSDQVSSTFVASAGPTIADGEVYVAADRLYADTRPSGSYDRSVTSTSAITAGGDLAYLLKVHNAGPATAYDVGLTDAFSNASLVSVQSSQGVCNPPLPGAPSLVSVMAGDHGITVSWRAPALAYEVTGYGVYRGTTFGGETLLATVGPATTFLDLDAPIGLAVYYKVRAMTVAGAGPFSDTGSNTIPTRPASAFLPLQRTPLENAFSEAVAIGDVNGDGRNDVVLVATGPVDHQRLFVFAQTADRTLAAPVAYTTDFALSSVAIGDPNGDGRERGHRRRRGRRPGLPPGAGWGALSVPGDGDGAGRDANPARATRG